MKTLTTAKQHELTRRTTAYSGQPYDGLSLASKVLSAISFDNYPTKAFDDFVDRLQKIHPRLASGIAEDGIEYYVLAQGENDPYTTYVYPDIGVTTGEWDVDVRGRKTKEWQELCDRYADEILDAREAFEEAIVREVITELEAELESELTVEDVVLRYIPPKI